MRNTHADPTADQAIANIMREEARRERALRRRGLDPDGTPILPREPQPEAPAAPAQEPSPYPPGVWHAVWNDKVGRIRR